MVVELRLAVAPTREPPARRAHSLPVPFVSAGDEREGGIFEAGAGVGQDRTQTDTSGRVWHFKAAQVDERGIQIDELDERRRSLASFHPRCGESAFREWDADADLRCAGARWYDPSIGQWLSVPYRTQ